MSANNFRSILRRCIAIVVLLPASASVAADGPVQLLPLQERSAAAQRAETNRIVVGQKWKWEFIPNCPGPDGAEIEDQITFQVTVGPTYIQNRPKATVVPNPVQTYTTGAVKVRTTTGTSPGNYSLELKGNGTKPACQGYLKYLSLTVAPKLTPDRNSFWWFDNRTPNETHYPTRVTLTALPAGQTSYFWEIVGGGNFALFPNNSAQMSTASNTIEVISHDAPPKDGGDFEVTVNIGGVKSNPVPLRVRTPHRLVMSCIVDTNHPGGPGFRTFIGYQIRDQFNKLLGDESIPANEQFAHEPQEDDPNADWIRGKQASFNFSPRDFHDVISVWLEAENTAVPSQFPCPPGAPECLSNRTYRIDHWRGTIRVGAGQVGAGVPVARLTWQRFRDHGRHCRINSPLGSAENPAECPVVTRRCNFPEQ